MFIEFSNYKILFLAICIFVFGVFYYLLKIKKKKYESQKTSLGVVFLASIKKRSKKDMIMSILVFLSLVFLITALADPQMRLSGEKEGVNVALVIDSSGSMSANDFSPNRMEAAKQSAKDFISQMGLKDNIGVVSFSDSTRIVSFLTNDKERIYDKLESISANGGTAIGDGLAMGVDMVTSIPNKKKLIILLSDGEQNAGQISIDDAIKYANSQGVIVYTIGVGSNTPVVLGYDWFGRAQYAKLDEASLQKIAQETNGEYYKATDSLSLKEIYDKLPELIKKEKELQSIKDYILWLCVIMLTGAFILKYYKKVRFW